MTIGVHEFWSFLLVFARITALFVSAPVLGNRAIPKQVKVGLAAIFAYGLAPLVALHVGKAPADLFTLIAQLAAETVVGVSLGFLVVALFAAIQIAGTFIDTGMGFGIINVLNPLTDQQTSATGQLLYQLGMVLFLIFGGHLFLMGTLAMSYGTVPPGGAHFAGDGSGALFGLISQMFMLAVRIALPAASVLLVVDVAFGIVARTVPQMNVFIVGMPIKIIVGLSTVALLLPMLAIIVRDAVIPAIGTAAAALLQAAR